MRDKIIDVLYKNQELGLEEIANKIFSKPDNKLFNSIKQEMKFLLSNFVVIKKDNKMFSLNKKNNFLEGKIQIKKDGKGAFGFLIVKEGEDIYIPGKMLNGAIDGDAVLVETIKSRKKGKSTAGRVISILERKTNDYVAEVIIEGTVPTIKLDNPKFSKLKLNLISYPDNLVDGHKVVIDFIKETKPYHYDVKIARVLGHKNEPGTDIKQKEVEFGIPIGFSEETLEEVKNIPDVVLPEEMKNRRDLRKHNIFTIDGEDTKDIDDAISLGIDNDGNYLAYVHLADVTHYVKIGSEIDKDAKIKGNSYYLGGRVEPMLPIELSNGICSLNEGVDRLALTVEVTLDKNTCEVLKIEVYESVLNSKKKMTYKNVNKIFNGEKVEGYENFEEDLKNMLKISDKLTQQKQKRGMIEFNSSEVKLIVDEYEKVIDVKKREDGKAENLIENFMILANESLPKIEPFIYRVHDIPKAEALDKFVGFLNSLGIKINTRFNTANASSQNIQDLLKELKELKEYAIFSKMILRTMDKAEYSTENIGHFGLASKKYSHFTAAIRRYSDIIAHRLVKKYYIHKDTNKYLPLEELNEICEYISRTERTADACEKSVNNMKIAEYMENHIGDFYEGMIDGVIASGLFVETDNLISGFVPLETIGSDLEYNENLYLFSNQNVSYRLGERVQVKCTNASKILGQVDFELIKKL